MDKQSHLHTILLVVLLFILGTAIGMFYADFSRLHMEGRPHSLVSLSKKGSQTAKDAGSVKSWMTFGYINKSFGLPDTYLQTALSISNSKYPKVTVHRIAKEQGLSQNIFLLRVQEAVRGAFSISTTTLDTSTTTKDVSATTQ